MGERTGKYWQERFKQMEQAQHDTSFQKVQEIQEQFDRSLAAINAKINSWYQRLADNNGVSMQEARKLLNAGELKEFHWNVEQYIRYGQENKKNGEWEQQLENASVRVHISRLEALKLEIQQEAEKLYGNCIDAIDQHIRNTYTSDFYHTAYEIQKGVGVGTTINRLDPRTVEMIVCKPWAVDGKNFSDRLWENKTKLINNLHNSLSRMCITGEAPDRAIAEISKQMKVSRIQAGRVVMTESAAVANKARQDCMKELDVEQFEVVETLDSHTCEFCGSMDSKHFPMSEFQIGVTAPPFHPNCRGCTCPYFGDEFDSVGERAARGEDGKTYYVPADTTYEEWKKSFVDNEGDDGFEPITPENKEYIDKFESMVGRKPNADEMSYTDADFDAYFLTGAFPEKVENKIIDFRKMSMDELKQYAANNIATQITNFDGVKLEYAQQAVETIQEFERRMGGTIEGLKVEFGNVRENAFAHYERDSKTLYLKKRGNIEIKQITDNEKALKKSGQVQHATTTYSGTMWHELGHAIDADTGEMLSEFISDDKELLKKAFKISTYASSPPAIGSPRASEAFAENFAAYMDGGANAKDVPDEIVMKIEKYFSEKRNNANNMIKKEVSETTDDVIDVANKKIKKLLTDGHIKAKDRLGLITNNNKSNPRYYDFKGKDLETVEREISQNDYETAVCFDKNGKAIFAQVQEGTEHQVKFTKYQMSKMKGLDVTHNHPYGTPPSPEDLYNILINGKTKSIRACGKNGTYVLKYTKEIENLPPYDIFNQEYENYSDGLMDKYWKRINNKEITIYEAEIQMQEETWQYLSNKYDIDYSLERR